MDSEKASSRRTPILRSQHAHTTRITHVRSAGIIRLLLVDDSREDAVLLLGELEQHGYHPIHRRVVDSESFAAAIRENSWDIVLSEVALPGFSATAALEILRQSGSDIPFIIVSGAAAEDVGVEGMRAGADDCFLKENLKRLIPAIERELREVRERTLQRVTADALETSELQFRHLWDNAPDGLFLLREDFEVIITNPSVEKLLGMSLAEIAGRRFRVDFSEKLLTFEEPDGGGAMEIPEWVQKGGSFSVRFRPKDSQGDVWLDCRVTTLALPGKRLRVAFVRDITRARRAEHERKKSEERYRLLADNVLDMVSLHDLSGKVLYVSPSVSTTSGWPPEYYLGELREDFMHPKDRGRFFEAGITPLLRGEKPVVCWRGLHRDGQWLHLETRFGLVRDENDLPSQVICSTREVGARVEFEQKLQAEKERLLVTLRSMGEGVITTDPRGRVEIINATAEKITGHTQQEVAGQMLSEFFKLTKSRHDSGEIRVVDLALQARDTIQFPLHFLRNRRLAEPVRLAVTAAPILATPEVCTGVVVGFRDMREQEKLEQEMLRASKLESIGVLAGGIAHDFNNLLTSILGNLSMLRLEQNLSAKEPALLEAMETAVFRATDLTRQLLTFSKGGSPVRMTASLSEIVRETASFSLHGSQIRCELRLPGELWPADVDSGQISQVLNNLLINASQAMPSGGVILIEADNTDLRRQHHVSAASLPPGPYILLKVRDQGCGIDPVNLSRIFDPFFSTKEGGSGLGLATAYNIIHAHGGLITVESRVNVGTEFSIYLPASRRDVTPARRHSGDRPVPGKGRVLMMDDDAAIRQLVQKMLTRFEYEVVTVEDGHAAIKAYGDAIDEGCPFDAVIMDLTIPGGLGGKSTMAELLKVDPEVRAIVASGYSSDPIMADFAAYGFKGCVPKPFKIQDLCRALQTLLEG